MVKSLVNFTVKVIPLRDILDNDLLEGEISPEMRKSLLKRFSYQSLYDENLLTAPLTNEIIQAILPQDYLNISIAAPYMKGNKNFWITYEAKHLHGIITDILLHPGRSFSFGKFRGIWEKRDNGYYLYQQKMGQAYFIRTPIDWICNRYETIDSMFADIEMTHDYHLGTLGPEQLQEIDKPILEALYGINKDKVETLWDELRHQIINADSFRCGLSFLTKDETKWMVIGDILHITLDREVKNFCRDDGYLLLALLIYNERQEKEPHPSITCK